MPLVSTQRPQSSLEHICYRGRFAPSPSGLLHFGSLVAALASYLDAKAHLDRKGQAGKWLLRIEDIDHPRELSGASSQILSTLAAFGLHWDEQVLYQSTQGQRYREILSDLFSKELSYHCQCTRAQIKSLGGVYQGHCRHLHLPSENAAIRLKNSQKKHQFIDVFQGRIDCNLTLANEDFIIHRKDGLFAYQLAVVADDIEQNINQVIRGADLVEPTARQLSFFSILNKQAPNYGHVPLALNRHGAKLSKQNQATALHETNPQPALISALVFLGQLSNGDLEQELRHASVEDIIIWAVAHWQRDSVPKVRAIKINE